jgi:hypothetical protein
LELPSDDLRKEIDLFLRDTTALEKRFVSMHLEEIELQKPKDSKPTKEMEEGDYLCYRFARGTYRRKPKTVLFLVRDGEVEDETPTYGPFLEEEIFGMDLEKIGAPMHCRIGGLRHTKSRNKERTFSCAVPAVVS